jgi:hypothetical protein
MMAYQRKPFDGWLVHFELTNFTSGFAVLLLLITLNPGARAETEGEILERDLDVVLRDPRACPARKIDYIILVLKGNALSGDAPITTMLATRTIRTAGSSGGGCRRRQTNIIGVIARAMEEAILDNSLQPGRSAHQGKTRPSEGQKNKLA